MEAAAPYVVDNETIGETYDDQDVDDVAFLAPRLAAYGPDDGGEEPLPSHKDDDNRSADASGEEDTDDAQDNFVDEKNGAASNEQSEEDANANDQHTSDDHNTVFSHHRDEGDAEADLSALLAVSRVRELLKFEGSSPIVAKSAAQAASEAVVLILRDLTKMAVDEASRKKRKTVTYDDVARVGQLYDRFSFLSDVLPASEAPARQSVMIGRGAAASGGFLRPQNGLDGPAPAGAKRSARRTPSSHGRSQAPKTVAAMRHPMPGETGMTQTTLRF